MPQQTCRLCLNQSSQCYNISNGNYFDQFKMIMPEIDLTLTKSPVICESCSGLLLTAYTFKLNCLEIEEKLKLTINQQNVKNTTEDTIHQKLPTDNCFDNIIKEEPMKSNCDVVLKIEDTINENLKLPNDNCFDMVKEEPIISSCDDKSKINLEDIEESRKNLKTKIFICKFCSKKFTSHRSWYTHFKLHTGNRFNCEMCSEGFNSRSEFLIHKQKHRGVNKCQICGKIFLYKAVLDRHMKVHNGSCGKRMFECNVCGLKTKLKCKLLEHLRIHTGERPYKCTFCDKTFTQSSTLSTHLKGMHSSERPFTCDTCGKSYAVKGQYTAHLRTHSSNIPKNCVCSYCGKSYATESKLQTHIKKHTGDKPIVCDICSKQLSDTNSLRKHMRIHTGEKPYECTICQKKFTQKYNMYIHFKSCAKRHNLCD